MLVLKIAWRNIFRHKGKSLIIGSILFLGAFIMVLGNATSIGMKRGIEENMVKSFTGHVILVSDEEPKDNVLFTPMAKPLKILKEYVNINKALSTQDFIKDYIPMTRGGVALLGGGQMSFLLTFGCNFEDFQRVYGDPMAAEEGELLKNDSNGMLVNMNGRKMLYSQQGFWLVPEGEEIVKDNLSEAAEKDFPDVETRETLALTSFGEPNATDLEVPIRGIVRFKSLNALMQELTIMDIETYRRLFGFYTAEDIVEEIPIEQEELLAADEDDWFGEGDIFSGDITATSAAELEKTIKTNTVVTRKINYDTAAYNYVSIILQPGENLDNAVEKIDKLMKQNNLPVKVLSWRTASGQVANLSDIVSGILGVFVFILFFVAIIIIMNTLSMTAMERTEEFGMMRAVGARKGFISKMFLSETFFLSFIFGGLGILMGVIVTWIVRPLGINSGGNEILEMLFGGEIFTPILGFMGLVNGIINLGFVTLFAVIYPLLVARKISPLDAINRQ